MIARLLEKIELWIKHTSRKMPYTVYCYYCNKRITAPSDRIIQEVQMHNNTPAHQRAKERSQ